jgi:antitoxin component HigA of HigAB toxin-antitoxin module
MSTTVADNTLTLTLPKMSPKARAAASSYHQLAVGWRPRPILSDDDYDAAVAAIDPLVTRTKLDEGEREYREAVAAFIETYDREHFDKPVSTLPERIEHLLESEGMTQSQLADVLGKSKTLVSDIMAGRRSGFTRDQIATLADRFKMDHGYFF